MKHVSACILLAAAVLSADDTWTTSGKDADFPQERFFVGIGISGQSQDAAKQNALVEVRKQLSVSISSTVLEEQSSIKIGKKERATNRTDSRTKLSTSGEVQGIEVVKTAKRGKGYYALAVLDKKHFAGTCRSVISELQKEITGLVDDARVDLRSAQNGPAVIKLSAAQRILERLMDIRKLLSAAAALADADKLPVTHSDIAQLYEQCASSLKMAAASDSRQSCTVASPAKPIAVIVTASGTPAPGIPVSLLDERDSAVQKTVTGDDGVARFPLNEAGAVLPVGKHTFTAVIALSVLPECAKILAVQNRVFSCTVTSDPGFARLAISIDKNLLPEIKAIENKTAELLSRYDIRQDPTAESTLLVSVSATGNDTGRVRNADVTLSLLLRDDDNREILSLKGFGRGAGESFVKAALSGIEKTGFDNGIIEMLSLLRKKGSETAGPKLRIAVFEFISREAGENNWPILAGTLSEKIITELINTKKVEVVERSQLSKIIEEKMLQASGLTEETEDSGEETTGAGEDDEMVQIARLAGADLALLGSGAVRNDTIDVDARIIVTKNGVARCAMKGSALKASLSQLAKDLVGQSRGKCLRR
ncbi:MAG: LPP20 family lipoprotein [Chitinispirillaceae bacterium]|jgi:TolB-like protein|nr:LPP20 family lipoprotein [Chitinispirillaceae bacterium]